jgi:hypothetical protein
MSYIVVDVEADGQIPGINSMVCFGAVVVRDGIRDTFYGQTKPISTVYEESALAISGFTREQHKKFEDPKVTMQNFQEWVLAVNTTGRATLITDNPAFDFAYINYYMHVYCGKNIFGWSARRIGDLFCGFYKDASYQWKKHRVTKHTHHPVADALGNAEALLYLRDQGLKIKLL